MSDEMSNDQVLEMLEGRLYGKYRGIVQSNEDPTGRGRLQVSVPAVLGSRPVWAMPCVPYAGQGVGLFALPPVGAGVWVEFEAGDPSYPIWVGCFWAQGEIEQVDAQPMVKFWKTDHASIRIDDNDGTIEIANSAGSLLRITATDIVLESTEIDCKAGTKKTALTPIHFDVHDGAFTVV